MNTNILRLVVLIPEWRKAMDEEYSALLKNHPWDLVPLPKATNIIGTKWFSNLRKT